MRVFDETPAEPSSRLPLVGGVILAAVLLGGGFYFFQYFEAGDGNAVPTAAEGPTSTPRRVAPPVATTPSSPAPAETAAAAPAPAEPRRTPVTKTAEAPAAEPAPTRAEAATLVVESDVPGASVFVDREFVGTAPVTLKNVALGSRSINLSAEGFEGVRRTVDVVAGDNAVTLRFKEVRLNATVGVAHKHGVGGCDGTLRATVDGLVYETSSKSDAFTLPYAQVESFEVNYLEKNLRVKQKGGKTWNFTDKAADNADRLFVFHRDVTAAREKLANGYSAAR